MLVLLGFVTAVCAAQEIKLPSPILKGAISLEESILHRRSQRSFQPIELSLEQISQLLWSGQGITDNDFDFRTAPSAGSIYPLQVLLAKADGVYKYVPQGHKLLKISDKDKRASLVRASIGQGFIGEAPVDIIITGLFDKTRAKYGMRADRYVFMEAGHAAENICLQATAMGLGSVVVGSFWDDVISATLELGELDPIYIIPIGYVKQ